MPGTVKAPRKRSGKGRGVLRASCDTGCGYHGRFTMAMMRVGLARCGRPGCDGRLVPDALEDALALHAVGVLSAAELETHGEYHEYARALESIAHGQAGPGRSDKLERKRAAAGRELQRPETIALERVHANRALERNRARHAALAAHAFGAADKAATAAEMPF